ncbi:hypothetical protein PAXINDRAFT_21106 [Paxillus involutus ATCC 200175]|uniref:Unplaced genomic scaffold PAXINscaffold_1491, whole genome shotgun sequence n=1 Tax=Paxillus involutus ATCC 200175 TaxID=664439 RepID=A0A0C9T2E4_PAXIN|nr:hypothetical protein PAXINDRAFT_21106 [Paxillus involutus ATCC 200175]
MSQLLEDWQGQRSDRRTVRTPMHIDSHDKVTGGKRRPLVGSTRRWHLPEMGPS